MTTPRRNHRFLARQPRNKSRGSRIEGRKTSPRAAFVRAFLLAAAATILTYTARAAELPSELRAAERLMRVRRPLVIAHRGYPTLAPENTLPAFEFALTAGADLVELDYHPTRDGALIVIHDYELDRTTDGDERWKSARIRVDARTAEELRTLDAGSWFHPRFAGTPLPLLTEALDLIQQRGVTLIERKAGDAAACVRLLRERDLLNRVVVQSFDWNYLAEFHKQEPTQILGALGPPASHDGRKLSDNEKILSARWVDDVEGVGARLVVWNRQITRQAVRHAHKRRLKVWVYTINDPVLADHLLDLGVDGIITDNTALIWRTLALRAAR